MENNQCTRTIQEVLEGFKSTGNRFFTTLEGMRHCMRYNIISFPEY